MNQQQMYKAIVNGKVTVDEFVAWVKELEDKNYRAGKDEGHLDQYIPG